MSRFYLPDALYAGQVVELPDNVVRHLNVLRMRCGEEVVLFNGNGKSYPARLDVFSFHADADFHGGSACVVDAGVEGYQVADVYRLFKQDFIDRQGNAVVAAVTAGAGISDLVEQAQKFAAVDVAAEIGGVRHHQFGHDEFV